MGIQGLLPLLKSIQVNTHIKHYAGKVVGIDAYVWLHKGAFACAWDLALSNPTTKYVDYAIHRIRMLRHYGVEPYVVFDGDYLPSKLGTESSRAARREEQRTLGMRCYTQKQHTKAMEHFQRCIDVTPEMAWRFILALKREGVRFVVAPYEADAQLAYLEKRGMIQAIVTEDSDLLVFGCRTLLLKMSQFGDCVEIKRERFANVTGQISLHGFTDEDFRHMAILSGCDYLEGINGVGLITAYRLLRRFNKNVQRAIQSLRMQAGTKIPPDYMDHFNRANLTFKHQRVFCPEKESLVMWNQPEGPISDELHIYIGVDLEVEIARGVARGELHPMTKVPFASIAAEEKENAAFNKTKSIKSFFKAKSPPKRTNSLRDITPTITKADEQKANTPPPKQIGIKRPFTADAGSESIAVKRAKKFFDSNDTENVASPFFSTTKTIKEMERAEPKVTAISVMETQTTIDTQTTVDSIILFQDETTETVQGNQIIEDDPEDALEIPDENLQVSESPLRNKEIISLEILSDEIILDSPTCIRTENRLSIQTTSSDVDIQVPASPEYHPKNEDLFPPSPPLSRPASAIFLPKPSHRPQTTPTIQYPGIKKGFTPRPSNNTFPDTPTPSPLSQQQSVVVKGWKERFLHNSAFSSHGLFTPKSNKDTPKLSNTISSRPMTPLHTPLLRRRLPIPMNTFANAESKSDVEDQIEDSPKRKHDLQRFRFQG